MKKIVKIVIIVLLAVVLAALASLGIECMLNLLSFSFGVSLDGGSAVAQYPRFVPFCTVVGFFSLAALVCLVLLNIKFFDKLDYTDAMWKTQVALAVILTLPMIKLWEMLFDFLQKTF